MKEIIPTEDGGLLPLLHGAHGAMSIPMPYERDILLFQTYVAGTTHVEGIEDLEPFLKIGDRLNFVRDPHNIYDHMAVVVKTEHGVKIGFIPQKDNIVFARLMDAGKLLFGRITEKEIVDDYWVKISMDIFLHE